MTTTAFEEDPNLSLHEPLLGENEHDDETMDGIEQTPPPKMTNSLVMAITLAVFPMFHYGYHIGVLNAPASYMFPSKSIGQWAMAVSIFCVGGVFGANMAGGWADRYGRKRMLILLGGGIGLLGSLLSAVAPTLPVFIAARLLLGWSGGAATVLTPLYLGEVALPEYRGTLGTLTQLATVIGILVSAIVGIPLSHDWRWLFWPVVGLNGLMILFGILYLHESPQWLLLHHYVQRGHEAKTTLDIFYQFGIEGGGNSRTDMNHDDGEEDDAQQQEQLNKLIQIYMNEGEGVGTPEAIDDDDDDGQRQNASFCLYLNTHRIPVLSVFVYVMAQQLSGINAVFYYSTSFLQGIIDDPQKVTLLAFAVNVVSTLPPVYLMDRFGRKTWLLVSLSGMAICCIGLTLSRIHHIPLLTVITMCGYIVSFEFGLGCIPFFLAGDLIDAPQHMGTVQSWAMTFNWACNFLVGVAFPYLDRFCGNYSFLPFFVVLLLALWYTIWILPEIKSARRKPRPNHEPVSVSSNNSISHEGTIS